VRGGYICALVSSCYFYEEVIVRRIFLGNNQSKPYFAQRTHLFFWAL
jgi:hypothetical protein